MSILADAILTDELLTGGFVSTSTSGSGQFIYGGTDIQDCANLFIDEMNYNDINQIDLSTFDSPQTDGGGVAGYFVRGKTINFKAIIKESTEDLATAAIGNFKKVMFGEQKPLIVRVLGLYRTCLANLTSLRVTQDDNKKMAQIDIELRAMEDFHLVSNSSTSYLAVTSSFNPTITNSGEKNTNGQFIFVFGAGNVGITALSITIGGFAVTVNQAIVDGDVLVIDGELKKVTLNSAEIDYDGVVDCALVPGYNVVQILFTATTLVFDMTEIHRVNFL